ncbi:MAG: discoidin domain-containing protein, partial [Chitinophagaceae bacterium]|nr:discoidin domain-containing protein [Chitinophagaceae bacterium]
GNAGDAIADVKSIPIYSKPITITADGYAKAVLLSSEGTVIDEIAKDFSINLATGKKIKLTTTPAINFPGEGNAFGLINGVRSDRGANSTEWLGWQGADMEAVIDLGTPKSITSVSVHVLTARGSQPCKPQWLEVFTSIDGKNFIAAGKATNIKQDKLNMGTLDLLIRKTTAQFIRVKVKGFGKIPDGMPGAGNDSWLFLDEIQIR